MDSVPLLPEKFGGSQEWRRAFLPAHHVAPLIEQQRQVAPGLDPLAVHDAEERL